MTNLIEQIAYCEVPAPITAMAQHPVDLSDETMQLHKEKILMRMKEEKLIPCLSIPTENMG